jgi:hypothetical protein
MPANTDVYVLPESNFFKPRVKPGKGRNEQNISFLTLSSRPTGGWIGGAFVLYLFL